MTTHVLDRCSPWLTNSRGCPQCSGDLIDQVMVPFMADCGCGEERKNQYQYCYCYQCGHHWTRIIW